MGHDSRIERNGDCVSGDFGNYLSVGKDLLQRHSVPFQNHCSNSFNVVNVITGFFKNKNKLLFARGFYISVVLSKMILNKITTTHLTRKETQVLEKIETNHKYILNF